MAAAAKTNTSSGPHRCSGDAWSRPTAEQGPTQRSTISKQDSVEIVTKGSPMPVSYNDFSGFEHAFMR